MNAETLVQAAVSDPNLVGVKLQNITKAFGTTQVLKGITFDVEAGELLVLLGPSGCGKTTSLNVIAGVEQPDSGRIYFGAIDVTSVPPEKRNVAMVFQTVGLYPHLNVNENITFPLRLQRVSESIIRERVDSLTELLGIASLLKRRIHEISGGERQRVAIAKALAKRPRLFLLDEPFSNLDAEIRRQLRAELVRIHQELRTTMVFVTHDQEEAMSIGDRLAVMNLGSIVQSGAPLAIYQWPESLWVARFIGPHPINVIPIHQEDDKVVAEGDRTLVLGSASQLTRRFPDMNMQTAMLGVRPESIELVPNDRLDDGVVRAEVSLRQVLGSVILYDLSLTNGLRVKAITPSTSEYRPGAAVYLKIDWDQTRVFDRHTGKALDRYPGKPTVPNHPGNTQPADGSHSRT